MNPEKKKELDQHLQAIAAILYEEASSDKLETLGGIEETIRGQTLEYITPKLGFFYQEKNRNYSRKK
jgi:hypothetical protein